MQLLLVVQYAAILALQLTPINANPAPNAKVNALVSRAAGTRNDPHIVDMPCTDMEDVCEADCIAILCHGKDPVMQKLAGTADAKKKQKEDNYRKSGAYFVPFDEPLDMQKKRGISVPSGLIPGAPVFNSAEETTYESTQQGGTNCIIFPVPRDQQTLQGGNMQNQFGRVDEALRNIPDGQFFKQRFSFLNSDTPHCLALQQIPPDTSICHKEKKNKWGFDMKKFAFVMDQAAKNPRTFTNLFGGYKRKRSDGTYEPIEEAQEVQDE
ncbi:hypothetical protein HYALB_00007726 [Hymenoscyphus albidus]|uniref:Uncharacterized protein n=1 Tax=Hymenoscyphus albidus TaxID=595503 RepID=A0A9N9LJR0_9HELO|nr:hypothetical protein HYALB_00007726 [Hymenoscyphus albidus]